MPKTITNILLQEIVPAMSDYTVLRKQLICMAAHLPTQLNTQATNSLTSFWKKKSSLASWGQLKTAAIKLGIDYLANQNDADPLVLYGLLADCRRIIGKALHQAYHSNLGKPRTKGALRTALGGPNIFVNNPYADFYSLLKDKFNALPQKEAPTDDELPSHMHEIVIDGIPVAAIVYKKAEIGYPDLFLEHYAVDATRCALFSKCIGAEFTNYMQSTDEALIIESIAKLVYYFTLAMPLERGSAAVTEMLATVLLWNKKLRLEYKDKMVMDLAAYFSGGIDPFVTQFKKSLVPMNETLVNSLLDTQPISTDDFAWSSEEDDLDPVSACHQM